MRVTFSYTLEYFFGKGHSHKMVAMVTRKRLSLICFFQSVNNRCMERVTKFQEKKVFRSSVIIEKPQWRWNPLPPRGFSRITMEQKKKNILNLDDLYYKSLVDTLEEKY